MSTAQMSEASRMSGTEMRKMKLLRSTRQKSSSRSRPA
jgi:hypothetical protein